jgi:hypothetical protein
MVREAHREAAAFKWVRQVMNGSRAGILAVAAAGTLLKMFVVDVGEIAAEDGVGGSVDGAEVVEDGAAESGAVVTQGLTATPGATDGAVGVENR